MADDKSPNDFGGKGDDSADLSIKKRKPKRILHFSDGILEEYSSEDEIQVKELNIFSTKIISPNSYFFFTETVLISYCEAGAFILRGKIKLPLFCRIILC